MASLHLLLWPRPKSAKAKASWSEVAEAESATACTPPFGARSLPLSLLYKEAHF